MLHIGGQQVPPGMFSADFQVWYMQYMPKNRHTICFAYFVLVIPLFLKDLSNFNGLV